jgi:hypothetical protein
LLKFGEVIDQNLLHRGQVVAILLSNAKIGRFGVAANACFAFGLEVEIPAFDVCVAVARRNTEAGKSLKIAVPWFSDLV